MTKLDELLRSSMIVADGFMGNDTRPLHEIVASDLAVLARVGVSHRELAGRMREISNIARAGLCTWVPINGSLEAMADDSRGLLVCPWPHRGRYNKTVTTVRRAGSDEIARWSELSTHLVEAHGFFQGKGSHFRIEPDLLLDLLL